MDTRQPDLEVRVRMRGELYAWELHFIGHNQAVRFSVPIFVSEADARNAGQESARNDHRQTRTNAVSTEIENHHARLGGQSA